MTNETGNPRETAYRRWRAENPQVFDLFLRYARQMVVRDRRFGLKLLSERVRWEVQTTWGPDEAGFKINNNHTAYLARDLLRELPALLPLLETRRVRGEPVSARETATRRRHAAANRHHLAQTTEAPHAQEVTP